MDRNVIGSCVVRRDCFVDCYVFSPTLERQLSELVLSRFAIPFGQGILWSFQDFSRYTPFGLGGRVIIACIK